MDLKRARNVVRTQMGERLAAKASDAFCLAHSASAFAESAVPPARSAVLEFSPQTAVTQAVNKAVEMLRASSEWSSIRSALDGIELGQVTRGGTREVMESGRSEPDVLPVSASRLLRFVKVTSIRDNFFKITGNITDTIERGTRSFGLAASASAESAAAKSRSVVTEVCWLNRTVRSWADARVLAEVAADDSIERIDVPRRLQPELKVSGKTVGAPAFREKTSMTGKGIIVAVIDSEVALNHPALKGRVVHKANYTDELWGNPDAHGTAVAGIIGSSDATFAGMAPEATIYNYKVLASNEALTGDDFDAAIAIQQALEDGAHIANCSWGAGPATDGKSREAKACNAAWDLGLILVKSSGNRGPGLKTCTTPADADGVIVVGATGQDGAKVQGYSSRGTAAGKKRPHLIAPGGFEDTEGMTSCLVGGGFGDVGHGTSYAAPHVSGLAALLVQQDPARTPDNVRDLLISACKKLATGNANVQGKGLVSMLRLK
jgi:serine protease AprX